MIKNTFSARSSLLTVLLFTLLLFLFACDGASNVEDNSYIADEDIINEETAGKFNDDETIDLIDLLGDNDEELEHDEKLEEEKINLLRAMEFRRNTQSRFVDHIETFGFERNDGVKVSMCLKRMDMKRY